tara:strand:- start:4285 stop:4641 length:357 start_codon:yes stop_codon:yes gene_type:complete
MIKFISPRTCLYTITSFIMCVFFPWWIIAVIGTVIGFFNRSIFNGVIESNLVLFLCWLVMIINNFFIDESKFLIVNRIQDFLGMNQLFLIIITLMIPFLVGTLASIFGYQLRKVVSDD